MQFTPLTNVQQRVEIGAPLPFNIRDSNGMLLLAHGQWLTTADQREALFNRGALVDLAELRSAAQTIALARPDELPGLRSRCMDELVKNLSNSAQEGFVAALDDAASPVLALLEWDKDLAIFQVRRQNGNANVQYGVHHAMHAAITGCLVAQRLGWTEDEAQPVFKAALTMNISMLALQGQRAVQGQLAVQTSRARPSNPQPSRPTPSSAAACWKSRA